MSIADLFEPNNYDLFCDSLTANTLNIDTQAINTLAVNTITSNPTGGTIAIQDNVNINSSKSLTTGLINVGTINSNISGNAVTLQGISFYPTNQIQFPAASLSRKLSLYSSTSPSDTTEFYGFGVQPNTLVYQTQTTSADHVFYAGTGVSTNIELFRVKGSGGGVILPSVGAATAAQLNYYETISATYSFTGIWAGSQTGTVSITRIGNRVTLNMQSNILANATTSSFILCSPAIPTRLSPAFALQETLLVQDNGTQTTGFVQIQPGGTLSIYKASGSNFYFSGSSSSGTSGVYGFSVTYLIS